MGVPSPVRLFKRSFEYLPKSDVSTLPRSMRGFYVLYRKRKATVMDKRRFDVVYVGIASAPKAGIRTRLWWHNRSETKRKLWTHCSAFEVWDNITADEIKELEGLFRHLYRHDTRAN